MPTTVHVHALIDSLGCGGAEMLLPELAAVAGQAGLRLTVGHLQDRGGSPAAARLAEYGVAAEVVGIGRLGPAAVRAVRAQIAAAGPDIVHTHLGASDLLGGLAARSASVPAVSTLHQMRFSSGWNRNGVKERLFAAARRHCMTRVVAVSDSAREGALAARAATASQLVTLPNGVVGQADPGAGPGVRAELDLAPDSFVVTMVSALRPEKNHAAAAAAFALLSERVPTARLVVVGDGPDGEHVARMVAPLGHAAILTGYREDVMAVLAATDILLHPSLYDALPTSLMDGMAASVPVVATAVGGIPELVEDGVTGVLVDAPPRPEDLARVLEELAADPGRRLAMAAAGRRRFEEHFSAVAWALRLRALYDSVLVERVPR